MTSAFGGQHSIQLSYGCIKANANVRSGISLRVNSLAEHFPHDN